MHVCFVRVRKKEREKEIEKERKKRGRESVCERQGGKHCKHRPKRYSRIFKKRREMREGNTCGFTAEIPP